MCSEYSCCFGAYPETQSVMPLVDGDFLAAARRRGPGVAGGVSRSEEVSRGAAVTVVLAAGDYPSSGDRGTPIEGVSDAEASGALVFRGGTALDGGRLVTSGGRLLGVTAKGRTPVDARARAYDAADLVRTWGARRREDIALAAAGGG